MSSSASTACRLLCRANSIFFCCSVAWAGRGEVKHGIHGVTVFQDCGHLAETLVNLRKLGLEFLDLDLEWGEARVHRD